MLVSNGTRVAVKANLPSPVNDPVGSAEQATNSDPSTPSDPGAADTQPGLDQKPEPEQKVLEQQSHFLAIIQGLKLHNNTPT